MRLFRKLPSIDEILLHPDGAPVPEEPSALIAIATGLGRVLTDHSIPKGMKYLNRMPTEMRVLAMRDAAARDRAITHTLGVRPLRCRTCEGPRMITERAMLAAVHISVWTAVKHDRKVSRDVANQHGAHQRARGAITNNC